MKSRSYNIRYNYLVKDSTTSEKISTNDSHTQILPPKHHELKIGDEINVHGYIDEIRIDTVIIRNAGGYFGTVPEEIRPVKHLNTREVPQDNNQHSEYSTTTALYAICPGCGLPSDLEYNYCPTCGSPMP